MKKWMGLLLAVVLSVAVLSGCGAQKEGGEDVKTLTGTLDEQKDFMFVVTEDQGTSYAFPIEDGKEPEGLEDVSVGDKVTVTYTGEVSEVDSFTGTVLSVEKAE